MLYLQEIARQSQQKQTLTLTKRLPFFLSAPALMEVTFHVEAQEDFYLIHCHAFGTLRVQCQRCLSEFEFPYDNQTVVAVCGSEEKATQMFEQYECVVSTHFEVSLEELLIDELHLYAPQFHAKLSDCNEEINQFLTGIK